MSATQQKNIFKLERMTVNLTAGGIMHMTVNLKVGRQRARSCVTLRYSKCSATARALPTKFKINGHLYNTASR